jgi:5'-3' exonuclease
MRNSPHTKVGVNSTMSCWDQLDLLPDFVAACGFQNAKAPGYEADDFLASAVAAEKRRHGTALVASGDRDTFQLASDITTILTPSGPARWLVSDPPRCATGTG